ncbi:HlyD family type I secretion periplasmic adaptor subunit [Novosphingobium guangzhouense]|uniref:Membrane fusion protein (MFP) family protein n=1 Tax=Novosphingobium guangzhouense TaxID=1850347 RepID=A0A2K2G3P6_9SPHN|nr:HlyD family type I secretion periplasmic adaptor subunit [Novosphingobium guangzhouense]PNU05641.1 rhizobiocin secretion protein RspE [Novosphingobium guangzhouense]
MGLWLSGILVFGLGGLAAFLPMAGAVIGPGEVTVSSHVKEIGHPTGGVVADIMVRDGDHVSKGQALIRFDSNVSGAAATYTGENVDQLLARAARLTAERDNSKDVAFPEELKRRANDPDIAALMNQERRTFVLRRDARRGMVAQLAQRISQSEADVASSRARARSYADQADLIQDELDATRKLYEKRYTTLDRLNALERSASGLAADTSAARESAVSGAARIGELRLQMGSIEAEARSSSAAELMDVLSRISELRRAQVAADDNFDRAVIRAPQSGTIDKLAFRTVGGVVPAGQTILELVPDDDRLVVETTISPVDIDQVRMGQKAVLRFSAFSTRTTPELTGTVTHVSADRTDDKTTHSAFYRVTIALDKGQLARLGGLQLRPGMPVETFIQTNERTMLSYILKPLADQLARAFREG